MSKVLVDRELLSRAADVLGSQSFSAWDEIAEQLRAFIAQPAEAEGVQLRRYTPISQGDHMPAMNSCDQGGWVRHSDYLAALSAVTAERDRLRDAAGKAIAWLDAEQNGSGVGINRRLKLCRDAENSLRAAMAAKEA
ncbi:hypothetical protein [Pelagibacterium sp.]|uniref:hypothetical protein n=1 Tax=Pelagibacterium sp. TaxID=1967288 RepID=UPI003A9262F8